MIQPSFLQRAFYLGQGETVNGNLLVFVDFEGVAFGLVGSKKLGEFRRDAAHFRFAPFRIKLLERLDEVINPAASHELQLFQVENDPLGVGLFHKTGTCFFELVGALEIEMSL